ncbi:sortase A [Butyrivibrio proteoclasticus]|uniref:Sortase A n=1 Tax=Butyrivibrio proteoclasticus TaxID=43305 RepID=A0A1I5XL65_9FIRM|nr:class C sortase [Butyrivibrio proteoclasticus]SFQ32689.1 sortase A [Butyrivibrio proteoclasticus]
MKKKKGLKKQLPNLIFGVIFLVGVAIFLYPSVSNYVNSIHQSRAINSYDESISTMSQEDYTKFWQAAYEYNKELAAKPMNFTLSDEELTEYNKILDPTGTGVIGYIEIENIGVNLPIYHGTEESVLQVGIGHLEGTSFPTGTSSTHVVLSGHRGLPSSRLFTDLDQMIVGDTFLLHIMDQTFAYQVDKISIVLPEEVTGLAIVDGEEYVTLVTCTPYGVNTHRLLVRAKRVDYNEETKLIVPADATRYGTLMIAPFIGAPMLLIAFIVFMVMTRKPKAKNSKKLRLKDEKTDTKS